MESNNLRKNIKRVLHEEVSFQELFKNLFDKLKNQSSDSEKKSKSDDSEDIQNKEGGKKSLEKDLTTDLESDTVLLLGGLDNRVGDLNIGQQSQKLKSKLGGKNVLGFRYKDVTGLLDAMKKNPDSHVVLFSAGCNQAGKIAQEIKNKKNLYIVEPYAASKNVSNSVRQAVSSGVPSSNVIVGPNIYRGSGVVSGATKTPSNMGHWGALEFVGGMIK